MPARNSKQKRKLKEKLLQGRQRAKCAICEETFHQNDLTLDHIQPLSKGGNWSLENLQLACRSCNALIGNSWDGEEGSGNTIKEILKEVRDELKKNSDCAGSRSKSKNKRTIKERSIKKSPRRIGYSRRRSR